jgi:integrase
MPRRKKTRPDAIGGYWLTKRGNSPYWCRTWYNNTRRQTCRASLGETDFERAKLALAKWVLENEKPPQRDARDVPLAEIFSRYWIQKGKNVISRKVQRANLDILNDLVGTVMVSEFDDARQMAVVEILAQKYANATIRRIFATGFAAINWAVRNSLIDKAPQKTALEDGEDRNYVASIEELARFWDTPKPDHIDRYFLMLLGTLARPTAILDLTRFQCNLDRGLIDLNPPGRKQTKKRRPIVPMCAVTRAIIETTNDDHIIAYRGRRISWANKIWRQIRNDAGLSADFIPYAMRHTGATELSARGVPIVDISELLGHRMSEHRSTMRYVKVRPDHQGKAIAALDSLFEDLAEASKRGLDEFLRPNSVRGTYEEISMDCLIIGAGDEIRTHDLNLGKVSLYP